MMKISHAIIILILSLGITSSAQDFQTYILSGDSCKGNRSLSKAISFYKKALDLKPERLLESEEEVAVFGKLADAYSEIAEYRTALEYFFKYIEKDAVKNNNRLLSKAYNKIGVNYNYLLEQDQALKFYSKCIETAGDDTIRIGGAYNNMANIYQNRGQLELAKKYYEKALKAFVAKDSYDGKMAVNMNIGIIEMQENRIETAFNYFNRAKELAVEQKDTFDLIAVWINLGDFYTNVTDYSQAKEKLDRALKYALRLNSRMLVLEANKSLVNLYKTKKEYKEAFKYLELYKATSDSIFDLNSSREYAELEARYSIREKEKENDILKKEQMYSSLQVESQKKYIWMLSGLVLLSGLFIILFYFQRKKVSNAKEALESQNKEIKKSQKQMNDLNRQYEKLIEKYEGGGSAKRVPLDLT